MTTQPAMQYPTLLTASRHKHVVVKPEIVFMYPPVGTQKVNLGRRLFEEEPVFRKAFLECDAVAKPLLSMALADVLYPDPEVEYIFRETINQPCFAQPCLFAVGYALTKLLESRKILPSAVVGHSIGEYAAAVTAGVLDMPTAMTLVCERGLLMSGISSVGAMMSVRVSSDACKSAINAVACEEHDASLFLTKIAVAAINGPGSTVLSGDCIALAKVVARLPEGTKATKVNATHADHSPLMVPVSEKMLTKAKELFSASAPSSPVLTMASTVTGMVETSEFKKPEHWAQHMVKPVLFKECMESLLNKGHSVYMELGAQTAVSMARECFGGQEVVRKLGITFASCLAKDDKQDHDAAIFGRGCVAVAKAMQKRSAPIQTDGEDSSEIASTMHGKMGNEKAIAVVGKASSMGLYDNVCSRELVISTLQEFGYKINETELFRGFFDYGINSADVEQLRATFASRINSADVEQLRATFASRLEVSLPMTLLFDYPSIKELSDHLDQVRGVGVVAAKPQQQRQQEQQEQQQPEHQGQRPSQRDQHEGTKTIDKLTIKDMLEIQRDYKRAFTASEFQTMIRKTRKDTHPDRINYIEAVKASITAARGKILHARGLVDDVEENSVRIALVKMNEMLYRYWPHSHELRYRAKELALLTQL